MVIEMMTDDMSISDSIEFLKAFKIISDLMQKYNANPLKVDLQDITVEIRIYFKDDDD